MKRLTKEDVSAAARAMQAKRKTKAGGRPRSSVPRCPCQAETLARCKARGKSDRHETDCPWFKAPR